MKTITIDLTQETIPAFTLDLAATAYVVRIRGDLAFVDQLHKSDGFMCTSQDDGLCFCPGQVREYLEFMEGLDSTET